MLIFHPNISKKKHQTFELLNVYFQGWPSQVVSLIQTNLTTMVRAVILSVLTAARKMVETKGCAQDQKQDRLNALTLAALPRRKIQVKTKPKRDNNK